MHFCTKCSNMYYIRVAQHDEDKLIYYCRNCGNEDDCLSASNICVSKTQIRREHQKFSHVINEYTKHDPTLPRIYSIKCPNHECSSNSNDEKHEVIYLRYDDINMKYIYLCPYCDTTWKTADDI
jgi:DNA-directed RNA polymerase subunit M/transcription elongation factor TFIIS